MFSPVPDRVLRAALDLNRHRPPWKAAWSCAELPHVLVTWVHRRRVYVLIYHAFSGHLVWARCFRPAELDYSDWADHREWCMRFLKKVEFGPKERGVFAVGTSGDLFAQWPAVIEYMTCLTWPTDPPMSRETCSLIFFAEDGLWKVCMSDRENDATLWGTGDSPEAALEILEGQLRLDPPPWRQKKGGGGTRRRH